MSAPVKQVTDVVRDLSEVSKRASEVAEGLKRDMSDVGDALSQVEELSKALRHAGAELRGALGTQTNNPPKTEG